MAAPSGNSAAVVPGEGGWPGTTADVLVGARRRLDELLNIFEWRHDSGSNRFAVPVCRIFPRSR